MNSQNYRQYFMDYLPVKNGLYSAIREWRASSNVVTSRPGYVDGLKKQGIGFESENEALMFMLMFYDQISAVEK